MFTKVHDWRIPTYHMSACQLPSTTRETSVIDSRSKLETDCISTPTCAIQLPPRHLPRPRVTAHHTALACS